jgi:hypothetical protein
MISIPLEDLATEHAVRAEFYSSREQFLIKGIIRQLEVQLESALKNRTTKEAEYRGFSFNLLNNTTIEDKNAESIIEINLTIFGADCKIILPAVLALEIVNRYLLKCLPVVDRELNNEEIAVVALISTLLISDWRELGVSGIYLRSVIRSNQLFEHYASELVIEESQSKQRVRIILDHELLKQLSARSKLILVNNVVTNLLTTTSYRVQLQLAAEINSLSVLLNLKSGVTWKLGENIVPAIELNQEVIGYGDLIINEEIGVVR